LKAEHGILCIDAEYFIALFFFYHIHLYFIGEDLLLNKCVLQSMPGMK